MHNEEKKKKKIKSTKSSIKLSIDPELEEKNKQNVKNIIHKMKKAVILDSNAKKNAEP